MANMFGALNRFISRLDAGETPGGQRQSGSGGSAFGFQVLRNTNKELNLEPFFDYIIGINGRNLDNADPQLFAQEVGNCKGASVSLGIWSAKGSRVRETYAAVPQDPQQQLGLSLQWAPVALTDDVWHILDVAPNSPADSAGLLPYGDYIIGSPDGLLKGEAGLGELVEDYLTRPLRLWVYNHEYDVTRLVTIQPSRSWGGSGALGCVLGYGALHRIPASLEEPPNAPGETLFESARLSTDGDAAAGFTPSTPPTPQYIVPADMAPQQQARQDGASGAGAKRERKHHGGKGMDMDAFFAEGEAKSREQDYASSPKPGGAGLAPPPKGSAPPRAPSPLKESASADSDTGEK